MPALGEEFRSAREARGLTLSNVAEQIYIRSVYLNAIEHEDWTSIGAPVYVRGFIRTYARFLGLDAESAIERFNQSVPPERPHAPAAASERERSGTGPSVWAVAGTLIAIALVALVGYQWWAYTQNGRVAAPVAASPAAGAAGAQPPASPAGSEPPAAMGGSAAPSPAASPRPERHHQLTVRLTRRSWLRVIVDGSTKVEGIFPAGTVRTFSGRTADVRAGNAGGVSLSADGRPSHPMGKEGDVVEQRLTL